MNADLNDVFNMKKNTRLSNPRYSKKDYEMVAELIKGVVLFTDHLETHNDRTPESVAYCLGRKKIADTLAFQFAERFADDNPRFNRERFLIACGVSQ